MTRLVPLACIVVLAGCGNEPTFREPREVWGQTVQPDVLNRGEATYNLYCMTCHGREGDGRGPQGIHMTPPPRDFRTARFRHTRSPDGRPTDTELEHTIRTGVPNTQMPAWRQLDQADVDAVIQYVKAFSS